MIVHGRRVLRFWILNAVRIREATAFSVFASILCWGVFDPMACSEGFFASLWLPACWALAAVSLLASRHGVVRGLGVGALFFPVAATYIHYAMALASHRSFLFAGILPWSDAYMHFVQAAQMAQEGFTSRPFNGRFLYPGFFSSLLRLSSFNMLIAQLVVGVIFIGSLYAALKSLLHSAGISGGALFTLLLWLYWRDHGASLVMTEQLGVILGILALPLLLAMSRRRSFAILLGALFLLAVGFSARPGALLVLPMMNLFAGWVGWKGWIFARFRPFFRLMMAMGVAGMVMFVGLLTNSGLQTVVFRGTAVPYGNFAYTLNGLIQGRNWEDSFTRYQGNPSLVMEENKTLLKQHPELLVKGVFRAYVRAISIKFLYSFDSENRLAAVSWLLVIVALVALWRDQTRRDEAVWISLFGIGILLSIPFAPPWDAGIRPYAVTIPFQAYLAALGVGVCMSRVAAFMKIPADPVGGCFPSLMPAIALSCLVLTLALAMPMIHAWDVGGREFSGARDGGVRFLPGSSMTLDEISCRLMRSGLDSIASWFRDEAKCLQLIHPGCTLGINWNDLGRYAALPDAVEFKDWGRMKADVRLLPR
jgi:hypothetical protein